MGSQLTHIEYPFTLTHDEQISTRCFASALRHIPCDTVRAMKPTHTHTLCFTRHHCARSASSCFTRSYILDIYIYNFQNCHSLEHTTRSFPSRSIAFGSCICFEFFSSSSPLFLNLVVISGRHVFIGPPQALHPR